MRGPTLGTSTTIPSNTFRPESTSIPFTVSAPGLVGNFSLPRWSTHALNAQKDGISLFKTESFNINGSYRFFAEVRDEHVEQLKLNFNVRCHRTNIQTHHHYCTTAEQNCPSGVWMGNSLLLGLQRKLFWFIHTVPDSIRIPREKKRESSYWRSSEIEI